jgi:DNA-binding MarR family transcriptional regulator
MKTTTRFPRATLALARVAEVLLQGGGREPLWAAEIARRSGLATTTVLDVLHRLEQWGWLGCEREDAQEAFRQGRPRRTLCELTPAGTGALPVMVRRALDRKPGVSEERAAAASFSPGGLPLAGEVGFSERRTARGRVISVPDRLWRLPLRDALGRVVLPLHLNWSEPGRSFDLGDRRQRARVYEMVLREGGPDDLRAVVDAALLADLWPDLVLPRDVRAAWEPLIQRELARTA